jgi:hypothetical protein
MTTLNGTPFEEIDEETLNSGAEGYEAIMNTVDCSAADAMPMGAWNCDCDAMRCNGCVKFRADSFVSSL